MFYIQVTPLTAASQCVNSGLPNSEGDMTTVGAIPRVTRSTSQIAVYRRYAEHIMPFCIVISYPAEIAGGEIIGGSSPHIKDNRHTVFYDGTSRG